MEAIYNNLISAYLYTKKGNGKKQTVHGDDELKEHYNEIVNYNKRQPVYILRLNEDNQKYILDLKDRSLQVMNDIKDYYDNMEDNYSKMQAVTDSFKVEAAIVSKEYDNLPEEFDIEVKQLASNQENRSKAFYADGKGLPSGNYSFEVRVNEHRYNLKYTIGKNTRNVNVLKDIARMINKGNIGINASLGKTEEDKVYLKLESEDTGEFGEDVFSFKDIPADGHTAEVLHGIVEHYNLNNVVRKAKSLIFDMNGQMKYSISNKLVLNKSLELDVKGIDGDKVHVAYAADGKAAFEAMNKILDSYNEVIRVDESYRNKTDESTRLVTEFKMIYEKNADELKAAGIYRDESGYLHMNMTDAVEAFEKGKFQEVFSRDSAFLNGILNKNKTISINPVEYTKKLMVTYPDYSKEGVGNSYMTSIFSGMLFNYYC